MWEQLGWEIVGGILGLLLVFTILSLKSYIRIPWSLLVVTWLSTWFFGFVLTIGPATYPAMVCATGIFALEAIRNTRAKERAEARVDELERLIAAMDEKEAS